MDEPIISVVVAVRDVERTLEQSLASVLGQTFPNFEVIIVDDGSTDRTGDIARQAATRDRRIRVLHQEKRGLAASLNRAIAVARGRYVARQDGDDVSMPERLDRQIRRLETDSGLAGLGTAAVVIDATGRPIGRFPTAHGTAAVRDGLCAMRTTPVHGSMMLRKERLAAVGGYREAFHASQDFDLWLRLLERFEIDNLDEPLYHWRMTAGSVYGSRRRHQLQYSGLALTFAHERTLRGVDSYPTLRRYSSDLEAFAAQYPLRGRLYAHWGELALRGLNEPRTARMHLANAIRSGHLYPRAIGLFAWSLLGFPWPGGKPLTLPASHS
jgi:glycosyltransferase involved in cell wall biosynthesis